MTCFTTSPTRAQSAKNEFLNWNLVKLVRASTPCGHEWTNGAPKTRARVRQTI
ncbi:hypothetical protein HanPSC8_Chr01g0006431 [Helianthus annuus]|nr:hypothetical protein HanPSC8_Chr01g0006431 [Helianthus annuus]